MTLDRQSRAVEGGQGMGASGWLILLGLAVRFAFTLLLLCNSCGPCRQCCPCHATFHPPLGSWHCFCPLSQTFDYRRFALTQDPAFFKAFCPFSKACFLICSSPRPLALNSAGCLPLQHSSVLHKYCYLSRFSTLMYYGFLTCAPVAPGSMAQ